MNFFCCSAASFLSFSVCNAMGLAFIMKQRWTSECVKELRGGILKRENICSRPLSELSVIAAVVLAFLAFLLVWKFAEYSDF